MREYYGGVKSICSYRQSGNVDVLHIIDDRSFTGQYMCQVGSVSSNTIDIVVTVQGTGIVWRIDAWNNLQTICRKH